MGLRTYLGLKRPAPSSRRPRIGIVAPIRSEAPYLLEWIAYHRALGVEQFVLGDNGGNDGTSELLIELHRAGIIERTDWRDAKAFQIEFDLDAVHRLRGKVDVCSITDADEFLRPINGHHDIPSAVAAIFARPEVSAAWIRWAIYGSSGLDEFSDGLVIERFTRRAPDKHELHLTGKTLVRPERLVGMENPHIAKLGGEYVFDTGLTASNERPDEAAFIPWTALRVDHFVVKSRAEYAMKIERSRDYNVHGKRDDAFFQSRDRNEVLDPMPREFIERTKREIARILDHLGAG
jgi:hypothetical protein